MSTVTLIAGKIKDRLSTLPGVESSSIDAYEPILSSAKISLVIPPFGLEGVVQRPSKNGFYVQSHRIPCEFWVKIDAARKEAAIKAAREIGLTAIRALLGDPTLGGTVQAVGYYGDGKGGLSMPYAVADAPITIAGVTYIVCRVEVPVIDYADK